MRKYIRHPSDIPIEVELDEVVSDRSDYLRNISLGGLCFRASKEIAEGTVVRLRIPLVQPIFEAKGRVTWCQPAMDDFVVGVEFIQRNDVKRARMVEQVCYIEHYRSELRKEWGRDVSGEEAALEWIKKYAEDFPHLNESPDLDNPSG